MVPLYGTRGGISIIIGGDFNSDLDSKRYANDDGLKSLRSAGLQWIWQNVPLEKRLTVPSYEKYPADCFDQILYGGLRLKSAAVVSNQDSSDHNPVVAILEL
jgi:endonuclease/exonuclease/phosphatase (EEP) superfamily protein YafD